MGRANHRDHGGFVNSFDRQEKRIEKLFGFIFAFWGIAAVATMLFSMALGGMLLYVLYLLITGQLPPLQ